MSTIENVQYNYHGQLELLDPVQVITFDSPSMYCGNVWFMNRSAVGMWVKTTEGDGEPVVAGAMDAYYVRAGTDRQLPVNHVSSPRGISIRPDGELAVPAKYSMEIMQVPVDQR